MKTPKEAIKILRIAGEKQDHQIQIAETALALACLEKNGEDMTPYQAHLDLLTTQIRSEHPVNRIEDQLNSLRQLLVVRHEYRGEEKNGDDPRTNNMMDVITRRRGSPILLGILYLHVAQAAGWAMIAVDIAGHFLLRLSARDGQILIDPFRAGQPCLIQEIQEEFMEDDNVLNELDFFDQENSTELVDALARPLSSREVLLRLEHGIKRNLLAQDKIDPAISTLQSMLLFAPQQEDLWREIGYLQAERGHLRAAITALEVVGDIAGDHTPPNQTKGVLRELRMRLN